uniref:Uncharacterized protein n=1 Tax=Romanomermis culicivorax TaxID=13658 RepID=A0A915JBC7_ROMCU
MTFVVLHVLSNKIAELRGSRALDHGIIGKHFTLCTHDSKYQSESTDCLKTTYHRKMFSVLLMFLPIIFFSANETRAFNSLKLRKHLKFLSLIDV